MDLTNILNEVAKVDTYKRFGKVDRVIGLLIEARGPEVRIGELCLIHTMQAGTKLKAEVIGFYEEKVFRDGRHGAVSQNMRDFGDAPWRALNAAPDHDAVGTGLLERQLCVVGGHDVAVRDDRHTHSLLDR